MKSRQLRGKLRHRVLAESLESRLFLSASQAVAVAGPNYDLVPSLVSLPTFSGPIVTGTDISAKLKVLVTNAGTDISPASAEAVTLLCDRRVGRGARTSISRKRPARLRRLPPESPPKPPSS